MAIAELLLPRTSDAMTEAVLSTWLVPNESEVAKGDLVAEVETDKALVEVAAELDGLLIAAVDEGATVEVGGVLAYLLDGDEVADYRAGRLSLGRPKESPPHDVHDVPVATQTFVPALSREAEPEPTARKENDITASVQPVFSSPLARRMARERGLRLEDLHPGTGPNGRVVRADVLRRAQESPTAVDVPTSARQRSMVAAMVSSKTEIPHFYLFRDVDLGPVLSHRKALDAAGLAVPSVTAILVKALGIVLVESEFARRRWIEGRVVDSTDASVGIAVADGVDDIVVPVVRNPGPLSLEGIASELTRLSEAVRARTLRRDDMLGAVATISNLGMFGVDALLPIIPPAQSFILGIGRDRPEVALDELGRINSRTVSTVSLAGDHRVMTGLGGARILERLDQLLQQPLLLASSAPHASTT